MKMIIPCAGFGTRMNMKPNESKEMLIDPISEQPLIKYAIDLADESDMSPLVITRPEKTDLIEYCKKEIIDLQVLQPHHKRQEEWPSTVLASQHRWHENNILVFPDTRFEPSSQIIENIQSDLELGAHFSIALHSIDDPSKWCTVRNYTITEKSNTTNSCLAMGLIGFKSQYGVQLFKTLRARGKFYSLKNTSFQYLDSFQDITRSGKVAYTR